MYHYTIMQNHHTLTDRCCLHLDRTLRTLFGNARTTNRIHPAKDVVQKTLIQKEREQSAAIMRINHAGEICAQALYHGQATTSHSATIREKMEHAALEEGDHLTWCRSRLKELKSHTSYLNPLWYLGSFCIGQLAGRLGDQWSLGFVAETERQVIKHLEKQCLLLPKSDDRSRAILRQMEVDEAKHQTMAMDAGAAVLPRLIQKIMRLTASVMVKTSYYV